MSKQINTTLENAKRYLSLMAEAIGTKLIDGHALYSGIEGHKRIAREIGIALGDFCEIGQKEILSSSYSAIYVKCCALKPLMDAKDWCAEMKTGFEKRLALPSF